MIHGVKNDNGQVKGGPLRSLDDSTDEAHFSCGVSGKTNHSDCLSNDHYQPVLWILIPAGYHTQDSVISLAVR